MKQKQFVIDLDIVDGLIRLLLPFKNVLSCIQTSSIPSLHNVIVSIFTLRKAHQIPSQLNISCKGTRQTIYKFDKFHTVATKPGAGRTPKVTERQKRLIKFQQVRDDTLSLTDLVGFARTDLNLTITRQTVSRILRNFDMVSYIAPRKPRITPAQRCTRVAWCYEHLSWSVNDW